MLTVIKQTLIILPYYLKNEFSPQSEDSPTFLDGSLMHKTIHETSNYASWQLFSRTKRRIFFKIKVLAHFDSGQAVQMKIQLNHPSQ